MSLVVQEQSEALALRVAEYSSVCKQQQREIEEQKALLEHQRKLLREREEQINMQEAQLIERDAQLQAQQAEIRALRRQHALDAEALRAASGDRSSSKHLKTHARAPASPQSPRSPSKSASSPTAPLRKQLQQAIADKMVLVRALQQLTAEMAQTRAEARMHAEASERSLSTAWRLGQLGQLGLQLLEMGEGEQDGGGEHAPSDASWDQPEAAHAPIATGLSSFDNPPNLEVGDTD